MAVASSSLAVGKNVPFTGAAVGAIAVQGYTGPFFGIAGMKLLREGVPCDKVVENVMADDVLKDNRQVFVIDATGKTAFWSGGALPQFAGIRQGEYYIAGGCGLEGQGTIDALGKGFESATGDLAERLLCALVAFDGVHEEPALESAALRISKNDPFPYIDLRIDSHDHPVNGLSRLLGMWRERVRKTPQGSEQNTHGQ